MNEFVNVAVVVCRTISQKKNDLMLKDIFDLHDASNRRLKKNSFPSNQICYFKVKPSKPIIFILASRNLDEINLICLKKKLTLGQLRRYNLAAYDTNYFGEIPVVVGLIFTTIYDKTCCRLLACGEVAWSKSA